MCEATESCARLASQLAREDVSFELTVREIASDALRLYNAGLDARERVNAGKSIRAASKRAQKIADRYGAQIVPNGDPLGMALGIRFRSGRHSSAAQNIFFIA